MTSMIVDVRGFNRLEPVVWVVMCHHVDMAIDWDEVLKETEPEPDELPEADEADERTVDGEALAPEVTPPADD